MSPADYDAVLKELDQPNGPSPAFRFELARRAFEHTGAYDTAIASTLGEVKVDGDAFTRPSPQALKPSSPARTLRIAAASCGISVTAKIRINPPRGTRLQPPAGLGAPAILQGKELSFTNLLDLDAAARIVLEFDEPAAAVIKHTNPCGVATGATIAEAYRARARSGFARGVRRHHRPQSHARRRNRPRDRLDIYRSRRRSRRRRGGAADPRDENQSSHRRRRFPHRSSDTSANTDRSLARCWCRSAIA